MKRRIFSLLMALVLTLCLLPVSVLAHGSKGIANNGTWGLYIDIYGPAYEKYAKKAYGGNAYTSVGCAWYACARAYELTGIDTVISSGASWYSYRYKQYGYTRGKTIRARALACYSNHTSFVEEVRGDQVLISEGGWPVYGNDCCIIQVKTVAEVEGKGGFIGYVYLPDTAPAVTITRREIDEAVLGEPYFQSIYCDCTSPVRYSLSSGTLPIGLTLSESGAIRGTPLQSGSFSFTVSAENDEGKDSASYSLTVREGPDGDRFFLRFESEGQLLNAWECTEGTAVELGTYLPERSGYRFSGWYADSALSESVDTLTVTEDTSVYARWEAVAETPLPFRDVSEDDWYYEGIRYVWQRGFMGGTDLDSFEPDSPMTRQMLWVVLARLSGEELSGAGVYAKGRDWAIARGISDGENAAAPLTRQQFATMLYRAAGSPAVRGNLSVFTDKGAVADYAGEALLWTMNNELIGGYADGTLRPAALATRAQVAAILMRYCENIGA